MNPGKELRPDDITGLVKLDCGLYGKSTNSWTQKHFKQESMNKGDIIYITCRNIIECADDRAAWAHEALDICYVLLSERKRWPDALNRPNDARNNIQCKLDLLRWKIWYVFNRPKPGHRLYRPQMNITRDPYIYFFTASVKLNHPEYIQYSSIPAHLYSPTTWKWHRYLKSGTIKDLESYKRSENRGQEPKHDYVKLLKHYRRMAVLIKLETK